MTSSKVFKPAEKHDFAALSAFLRGEVFIHRHLDWRPPLDWLGFQPFWMCEENQRIQATLALPDDPRGAYWVRLFAVNRRADIQQLWQELFDHCRIKWSKEKHPLIAALAYHDWMHEILCKSGWFECQRVVLLKWQKKKPAAPQLENQFLLRPMLSTDLKAVTEIDENSFDLLWRHSLDTIQRAFNQCTYTTVIEVKEKIVGYQMSTSSSFGAHLARLAVLPEYRDQGIGSTSVLDMLQHFYKPWIREITLNTQQDNRISQTLYEKLDFKTTGESYPIMMYSGK